MMSFSIVSHLPGHPGMGVFSTDMLHGGGFMFLGLEEIGMVPDQKPAQPFVRICARLSQAILAS